MSTTESFEISAVINRSPRPRVLILGFKADVPEKDASDTQPEIVSQVREFAPTVRYITNFAQVRQDEWDAVVTDRPLWRNVNNGMSSGKVELLAPHLCVVYVETRPFVRKTIEDRRAWNHRIEMADNHISQEFARVRDLPDSIASLVHEELEPVLKRRAVHCYFKAERKVARSSGSFQASISYEDKTVYENVALEPFSVSADRKILAGRYRRSAESEAWILPGDVLNLSRWIRVALSEWHNLAPDRFPALPDWSSRAEWSTRKERELRQQLLTLEQVRHAALRKFEEEEDKLKLDLQVAKAAADEYERSLLLDQDEPLKRSVAQAFSELGFNVHDSDSTAAKDDHLEDLQIQDPSCTGWVALVEVKGYGKGAKTEALTQFVRFVGRFTHANGRTPDALWYVVNQFKGKDPSVRQPALHGKNEDVAAFASAGGLVVDTVELFGLLSAVRDGLISHERAREVLRNSRGRFLMKDLNGP
ncbi:hypothetical protein AB0K14_18190 [Actinosynnema sp. NPDC050801]|uniref:hypothetical protein n=1 Tax=unclassified Actinosynnema TaxID=2637065 RepID=UPI0033C4479B